MDRTVNIALTLNAAMEKQSTAFICITYPQKHNDHVFSMHGARTKLLVQKTNLETTAVILGTPRVNNSSCSLIVACSVTGHMQGMGWGHPIIH